MEEVSAWEKTKVVTRIVRSNWLTGQRLGICCRMFQTRVVSQIPMECLEQGMLGARSESQLNAALHAKYNCAYGVNMVWLYFFAASTVCGLAIYCIEDTLGCSLSSGESDFPAHFNASVTLIGQPHVTKMHWVACYFPEKSFSSTLRSEVNRIVACT